MAATTPSPRCGRVAETRAGCAAGGHAGPDPIDLPAAPNYLAFFEDRVLAVRWRAARGQLKDAATLLDRLRVVYAESDSFLIRLRLDALSGVLACCYGRLRCREPKVR